MPILRVLRRVPSSSATSSCLLCRSSQYNLRPTQSTAIPSSPWLSWRITGSFGSDDPIRDLQQLHYDFVTFTQLQHYTTPA